MPLHTRKVQNKKKVTRGAVTISGLQGQALNAGYRLLVYFNTKINKPTVILLFIQPMAAFMLRMTAFIRRKEKAPHKTGLIFNAIKKILVCLLARFQGCSLRNEVITVTIIFIIIRPTIYFRYFTLPVAVSRIDWCSPL